MAAGILQRLLGNPEKAKRNLRRRIDEIVFDLHIDRNRFEPGEALALGLQRLDKSEIVEDGRMQPVGQRMDVFAELGQSIANLAHRRIVPRTGAPALRTPGLDGERSQSLRYVVMQLAGEP